MNKNLKSQSFLFFLLLFLISELPAFAQNNPADTLLERLQANINKHEADQMEKNALLLLNISEKEDDDKNRVEALKFLGISKHLQAKEDSAIYWYEQALKLSIQLKDSLNIAKSYLNTAISYNAKGDFEMSVKDALASMELFEKLNDQNGQGRVQNLLGIFYYNKNDFETALQYFEKYRKLALASRDTGEIVSSMNNLSATLHILKRYDKELQLAKQSIAIQEARGQNIRIGSAYENLGSLYLDTDSLSQAALFFEKAHQAYLPNNSTYDLARLLLQTARLKKKQKNYTGAETDILKSIELSEQGSYLQLKEDALQQLASFYEERLDYKNAYKSFVEYVATKDSVLNEKNQESINQLMIQFETEKKERQITQQKLEITQKTLESRHKSTIIIFLIGTIVILMLLSFVLYSRYKIKQERRLNDERMQMKQMQMKVVLESQESERKRFARDLHDGFGQLITAIKLMLNQMHTAGNENERNEIALKSNEVLDTMHSQLREIAHNLMPEQLVEEGLVPALRDYTRRLSKNTDIHIEVNTFGMGARLNQAIEINVYRIIQEWINNVIKYSGAKNLNLQLTGFENEINILIEDNGLGFKKEKLTQSSGWGWKNIQSRLEAINGMLEIDSREGVSGTSFILDFPIS